MRTVFKLKSKGCPFLHDFQNNFGHWKASNACLPASNLEQTYFSIRQLSGSCQAVVRQSSGSHQTVIRQSSGSCQAVVRQSSGSQQAVIRQSSGSHHSGSHIFLAGDVKELCWAKRSLSMYVLGVSPSLVSRWREGYSFWSGWGP